MLDVEDATALLEEGQVSWKGVDWPPIFLFVIAWEVCYRISKTFCQQSDHPKIREQGASYGAAFVNALVCSIAGVYITGELLAYDDVRVRALVLDEPPYEAVTATVFLAVQSFVGWLLMDLFHILTHLPTLGGWDTVLHHAGFVALAVCGYGFRVCPFVVGWLLLGEVSSLFLEVRFFLINSGRGETRAMRLTNYAFASTFFLSRVVVLWLGLGDLLLNLRPLLLGAPYYAPGYGVNTICGFVAGGALLNAFWMVSIVKMATRPAGEHRKPKGACHAANELRAPGSSPRSMSKRAHDSPPLTPTHSVSDGSTSELPLFPQTPSQAEMGQLFHPSTEVMGRIGSQGALRPCDAVCHTV